jgi:hypothetical protein
MSLLLASLVLGGVGGAVPGARQGVITTLYCGVAGAIGAYGSFIATVFVYSGWVCHLDMVPVCKLGLLLFIFAILWVVGFFVSLLWGPALVLGGLYLLGKGIAQSQGWI